LNLSKELRSHFGFLFGSASKSMGGAFLEIFSPDYRHRTILGFAHELVSMTSLWTGLTYISASVTYLAASSHLTLTRGQHCR
jgi:hypothetical protein